MVHRLWGGSEKRPVKLGLIVALFLTICVLPGNAALDARIGNNAGVQQKLITLYNTEHAAEMAERVAQTAAYKQRIALDAQGAAAAAVRSAAAGEQDGEQAASDVEDPLPMAPAG